MTIQQGATNNRASAILSLMTGNLKLNGANNYIDVYAGGTLALSQDVAGGRQNLDGGIEFQGHNGGTLAVEVRESGATLSRRGDGQVLIAGAVYNDGGTADIFSGNLNIAGVDNNGYSYWQGTAATALLLVEGRGNINATGTYEIDTGTVKLTVGGATVDQLDGAGLIFDNAAPTFLTMLHAQGTPGLVTVQGPVTLAANTTTTMNFTGGNNTVDTLDVKNGRLTLAGTLKLQSTDQIRLTAARNFFQDDGNGVIGADIQGGFASITDDLSPMNTYTGQVVTNNPQLKYYQIQLAPGTERPR
jgi:hypothetical protein